MNMNQKQLNVAMKPVENSANQYIALTCSCIEKTGVRLYAFSSIFRSFPLFLKTDLVILNWFETLKARRFRFQKIIRLIKKRIVLILLKITGKKIVFVFHNKIGHEEKNSILSKFFMRCLCKKADKIIILSHASKSALRAYLTETEIERKTFWIPHPNYIGAYGSGSDQTDGTQGLDSSETINLLFTGAIRPYKNIELILKLAKHYANSPFTFWIRGDVSSEKYKDQIQTQAPDSDNLHIVFEFVPDSALVPMIEQADALLLPYDTASSLNSGTVILSFSCARTVICPEIATVLDYPEDTCLSYSYENPEEHFTRLTKILDSLLALGVPEAKALLREKGRKAFSLVEKQNSLDVVSARYRELFSGLYPKRFKSSVPAKENGR